mmetsp:Transcript_5614/g.22714  ORF Transcript_5614/g.22714 Transcript_5614/m.22714 type:complete len:378 (+) Transcript_5614:1292-2425(+)
MKSRQPPTRPSRAFSLSHSFCALLFRFRSCASSFSSFSTRSSSALMRSVSFLRLHSTSTIIFRASSFHSSWNSSLAKNAASCASLFPEKRTRSTTSFRVFFLQFFTTASRARSRLKSSSRFTSGVPSSCCACPIASNAALAFSCVHLSGCTNSETLRNARRMSSSFASKRSARCSYGFSLKHDRIRSTSASRVASETSAKNSRSRVSESLISSMGGAGAAAAAAAAASMDSRAMAAFATASSSSVSVSETFAVSGSAGGPVVRTSMFARFKYVSSFVSVTTTWYRSRSGTYRTTLPRLPFSSGRDFRPETVTSVSGARSAVSEGASPAAVAEGGVVAFAAAADADAAGAGFTFTGFKYSSSPPSTTFTWYLSRSDAY